MKLTLALIFAWGVSLCAQPAPPRPAAEMEANTVLATLDDGHKLTIGELKSFMAALPPQMQQQASRDRKAFVHQFALMRKLAQMAEKEKLDQQSPVKESLEFNRLYVMTNAMINRASNDFRIPQQDLEAYYKEHPDSYTQVKVKVIYVSFAADSSKTGPGGKKYLSEPEAKAKIEKILKEARGGGDFVKLAKENSDDQASAAKDGNFGTIRRSDNLPDAIRNAVFALKQGEISQPIRQPNGFYVFRADELGLRPFEQVKDEIFNEVRQVRFKAWMDQVDKSLNVKYDNEAYFNAAPPEPAAPALSPVK